MSRSGGSYSHFPHVLSCVSLLSSLSNPQGVNSFRLKISLKICLTISLVSSSHSARIPLLSGDLPFWVCWLQFATLLSWSLGFLSSHRCCCSAHQCCFYFRLHLILVQTRLAHCRRIMFVEFSKDINNPVSRCDALSFLIFLCDQEFFGCPSAFSFFFVSDAFFKHLLTSFSLCFSPLGVFLLSSMSLRISASLTKMSSLTFAAADTVAHDSLSCLMSIMLQLEWNAIEPASSSVCGVVQQDDRQRCGQDVLHLYLLLSDMLHPHLFFPSIRCGRCFGSRSPASLFRQSLSCQLAAAAAAAAAAASVSCRRPTVLTPMPTQSWNTPSVCLRATARHASSFNFLCFCFLKCAICFCCFVFSFSMCFCVLSFFLRFSFFCGGGIFDYFNDFLVSFFELGHFNTDVFQLVYFFLAECCHDTSVVTSHVDHVIGFGVLDVFPVSSFC